MTGGPSSPPESPPAPRVRVGLNLPFGLWSLGPGERVEALAAIADAGVDHVFWADHVSFLSGKGTDGLIAAAALAQLHPTLGLHVGVYLLALRHPVVVARQVADVAAMAPGRLSFGVGVGGEDRHEFEVCGVDPRTRGRRTDEALDVVSRLLAGETVSVEGRHFRIEGAAISPVPTRRIPVVVGGRSDAAIARAARFGDGWLPAWCSPERFRVGLERCAAMAAAAGREPLTDHGYQVWVGLGDTPAEGRRHVSSAMEAFYQVPFERFARYTPVGDPEALASALVPFVEAGASHLNLAVCAASQGEAAGAAGRIRSLLNRG